MDCNKIFRNGSEVRVVFALIFHWLKLLIKKYFRAILIAVFLLPTISFSQTQKQWLKHAEASWLEKDYYGASVYYRNAMLEDSSNLYVVYRYAECLKMINDYKKAEYFFNYVLSSDRAGQFPDALFWLATMRKHNGKYLEARKNFLSYRSKLKDKSSYMYKKTEQEIASCEEALVIVKSKPKAEIYNLGDSLNTSNGEFAAAILISDSSILFSAINYDIMEEKEKKKKKEEPRRIKIYQAEKSDSGYIVKQEINHLINSPLFHNGNGCYDQDGNFYFSRCDDDFKCSIYFFSKDKNEVEALPEKINLTGYNNTQPYIADLDTTQVFFFASDRPGGYGGLDIWFCYKNDNSFSDPVNAGPEINTMDDEITPFYDTSSQALYFSSKWHKGLGGFDVFKSKGIPGQFGKAENAGIPINSGANDMYFVMDPVSSSGFLTSNRKGSHYNEIETCCNDIWKFKLIEEEKKKDTIIPHIKPDPLAELKRFIPIKLYFHNDEPNPRTKDTLSTIDYLSSCESYLGMVATYKEKYSAGLTGEKKKAAEDSIQSFFDHYVKKGLDELNDFAEELLKQLEKGYKLDLTVIGHASPLAKTDYNVNLTLRRISSLENYLRIYKGGVFQPYLKDSASNGGSLKIIRIPFGEYKAEHYISDNLNDKKSSVYSIEAALNRNIEIVSLTVEHKDSVFSRISFRKEIFDMGYVKPNKTVSHLFKFKNIGNSDLVISGFETSCECISVKAPSSSTAPGERGEVEVIIDTAGKTGKQIFSVTLITNGIPKRKVITVTAEVK
jgi:hypothetical protein